MTEPKHAFLLMNKPTLTEAGRAEARVFDLRPHLVVAVDEDGRLARVSFMKDGETEWAVAPRTQVARVTEWWFVAPNSDDEITVPKNFVSDMEALQDWFAERKKEAA